MNYKEASELAKKNPGSVLSRSESGEFVVRTRESGVLPAQGLLPEALHKSADIAHTPSAKVHEVTVKVFRATGAIFVFDSELIHPNPDYVYAFSLSGTKFREFEQSRFVGTLRNADESQAASALKAYTTWKAKNLTSFVESVSRDSTNIVSRSQNALAKRAKESEYRSTGCHSCGSPLSTATSNICSRCGGLKCECGSCLCQFRN